MTPIIVLILLLIVGVGLTIFVIVSRKQRSHHKSDKYPEGHFLSMGIAMSPALGIPFGLAMGNIALGIPLGLAIGAALGAFWEQANKDKIRPLTDDEKLKKRMGTLIIAGSLVLGLLVLVLFFYFAL